MLSLMAEGRSNAAIAEQLVISEGAVEKHVANIFTKFNLPVSQSDHRRVLAVLRFLDSCVERRTCSEGQRRAAPHSVAAASMQRVRKVADLVVRQGVVERAEPQAEGQAAWPSAIPGPRYTSKSATDSRSSPAAAPSTSATTSAGTSSSTTSARSMSEEGKRLTAAATMARRATTSSSKRSPRSTSSHPIRRGAVPLPTVRKPEAGREHQDRSRRPRRSRARASRPTSGRPSGPSGSGGARAAAPPRRGDQAHPGQPESVGQDMPGHRRALCVVVVVGEHRTQQFTLAREQRRVRTPGAASFDGTREALLGMGEHDTDFEQPDGTLAAAGVVRQRAQQSRHERPAQERLFGDQRVGDPYGRPGQSHLPMRLLRDEGVGPALRGTDACQHALHQASRPLQGGEMAGLGPGRRVPGNVGVPERPGHLLDHVVDPIGRRTHIGPVRGHEDRQPCPSSARTAVVVKPIGSNSAAISVSGQRHADLALHTCDRHVQRERLGHVTADVEEAVTDLQARDALGQQFGEAVDRRRRCPRDHTLVRNGPTPRCADQVVWTSARSPSARNTPPRATPRWSHRRSPTRRHP